MPSQRTPLYGTANLVSVWMYTVTILDYVRNPK